MASRKAQARQKQRSKRQRQRQKQRSKRQGKRQSARQSRQQTRQRQRTKRQAQRQETKRARVAGRTTKKVAQYEAGFAPGSGVVEVLKAVPDVLAPLAGGLSGIPGLEALGGFADAFPGGGGGGMEPTPQMEAFGGGFDDEPLEEEAPKGITSQVWFWPAVGIVGAGGLYLMTRKKKKNGNGGF